MGRTGLTGPAQRVSPSNTPQVVLGEEKAGGGDKSGLGLGLPWADGIRAERRSCLQPASTVNYPAPLRWAHACRQLEEKLSVIRAEGALLPTGIGGPGRATQPRPLCPQVPGCY